MGGLEVKNVEGKWVSADPIPGREIYEDKTRLFPDFLKGFE